MLTKGQALVILNEEKDYEEKMFRELVEVSVTKLNETEKLTDGERDDILDMIKHMMKDTVDHENTIEYLIKYVEVSEKDGF